MKNQSYIIIYPDYRVSILPVEIEEIAFDEGTACYSCDYLTSIDELSTFVFKKSMIKNYEDENFIKVW